jgi:hypothetical protein
VAAVEAAAAGAARTPRKWGSDQTNQAPTRRVSDDFHSDFPDIILRVNDRKPSFAMVEVELLFVQQLSAIARMIRSRLEFENLPL